MRSRLNWASSAQSIEVKSWVSISLMSRPKSLLSGGSLRTKGGGVLHSFLTATEGVAVIGPFSSE